MATATTADFFGQGGDISNPFATAAAPTAAPAPDPSALAARAASDPNSGVNQANAAFNQNSTTPTGGTVDWSKWYVGSDGQQRLRSTNETLAEVQKRETDVAYGGFLPNAAKTIAQHPWLLALPAAPFAVAGLGAEATGTTIGSQLGFDGGAAAAASAPAASATPDVISGAGAPVTAGAAAPAAATAAAGGSSVLTGLAAGAGGAIINGAGHLAIDAIMGGKTDADKALIAKQEQMASEAAARRDAGSQAAMDMMAQRMLAFAPMNNYLAMIGGQGNALSPQTVASMVQNPYKPQLDPSLQNYQGNDPSKVQEIQDYQTRMANYQQAEQARQQAVQQGFPPPPPPAGAPAMPAPLPPKKYF